MTYVIFALVGFIAGVLCAGYVVAVIGGIKTDIAKIRMIAAQDVHALHTRISAIEASIASKLP